jgi:starch synthase
LVVGHGRSQRDAVGLSYDGTNASTIGQTRIVPSPLRVLYATPEYAPLVKTGGLGDVAGALPAALRALGIDTRVLLPAYRGMRDRVTAVGPSTRIEPMARLPAADLTAVVFPGDVPGWLVDNAALYDRDGGPYLAPSGSDWGDNALRFGLLSRAAAWLGRASPDAAWRADVVHANDWQAGLAPAYCSLLAGYRTATMITLHNLAFQGVFDAHWVADLGLPAQSFAMEGVEYHGRLSFLKAGVYYADAITTVSPTYAQEIQHEPGGMGLHGLLATRRERLTGILNGIDTTAWDPRRDPHIARTYDAARLDDKAANKRALQLELGLAVDDHAFLLGVVARLTAQKGVDLVADVAPAIVQAGGQLALLGTGDPVLEQRLRALQAEYPGAIATAIGFDEALAHRIEAGADAFVMPSRFEPSGLNQMYSQRYGTPPIVHATGGLADSVVDCTPASLAAGTATGFAFREPTALALRAAIERAQAAWRDRPLWRRIQRNGMARDFGWTTAAAAYAAIYARIAVRRGA